MNLIPAIDLMDNQCVRLSQGDFKQQTVYSNNPLQTALAFEKLGFTHLHLVDLDGARQQMPQHLPVLKEVSAATRLFIDFSGGIRTPAQARQAFEQGASAITIGSLAVNNPAITENILQESGPDRIILGADVIGGMIATSGWKKKSKMKLFTFLDFWLNKGFHKVMITDVSKDGMMQGPSLEIYQQVLKKYPGIKLIASGGIASMEDIYQLRSLGCYGAITGKALYEGALNLDELRAYLEGG